MRKIIKTYIAMLMVVICFTACMDDEQFSTSRGDLLTFSTDTVKLDTCFSKVPTATKTFWVHNNSGKAIRCSTIRLNGGNQTGFRVNVDGIYLGASQGYLLNNEEIRKGDSIRVFVELTSPINGSDKPELVSDDLIFNLESGAQQKVNLRAFSWDADLLTNITLTNDSTLSGTRPTVIYGGITIPEGKILKIAPGKTVYFHDGAKIDVKGRLLCQGEQGNEVVLRGDRLDNMFDYLKYDGVSGQWGGIHFYPTSYNNVMTYTDIHSAMDAIVCDSSNIESSKLEIKNSTIHNNKGYGILSTNSNIQIANSQISNTLKSCVEIRGGKATLSYCTIAQFYPFDSNRGKALAFSNSYGDKKYPLELLKVANSIVTGYADDVIEGATVDSTTAFSYYFDHCLLRTPEVKDSVRCIANVWENVEDTICSGWKNFEKVDIKLQRYDFHLSEKSLAIGAALPIPELPTDREGTLRDEKPTIGCFEKRVESKE